MDDVEEIARLNTVMHQDAFWLRLKQLEEVRMPAPAKEMRIELSPLAV